MTYDLFYNRIISLPVLSYHIFLHLKFRYAWGIGYLFVFVYHVTTIFTVLLLIEYTTLSFEAYFSHGVYILTGQISWFTFLSFMYLIS
jgi:hypothetical protein